MVKIEKEFNEDYQVKFNVKKEDGYWSYGVTETVSVSVRHGENEKNAHDRAKAALLKKYPGAKIVSVTYV